MKHLFVRCFTFSLFCFLFLNSTVILGQEITTYYLIRHAEKEPVANGNKNPHLSKEGKLRAAKWKKVFQEVSLDNIYSTDFYRTQETAAPLAEEKNITVVTYDPTDLFNPSFEEKNKGKVVLVVGHSNTTPTLANKIIGKQHYSQIDENTFEKLYIIHIQADAISHQLLNIE